jgi:acetyltransferase-like isoleucine patch superfamily enzyme
MVQHKPKLGKGVIVGENVQFERDVVIWNYVVIGENTRIGAKTRIGSFCDIGKSVLIGKDCNIQAHVTISNGCNVGNNVFIGPNSTLLNDKFPDCHHIAPPTIKDGAIIGGGAVILPRIAVGKNSVVAAGSVVTKDVPSGVVVVGVPATKLMTRKEYEAKKKVFVKDKE